MNGDSPPWNLWLPIVIGGVYLGGQIILGILAFGAYGLWLALHDQQAMITGFVSEPLFVWVMLGAAMGAAIVAFGLTWGFLRSRTPRPMAALGFVPGHGLPLFLVPPLTLVVMMAVSALVLMLVGPVSVEPQEMLFEAPAIGLTTAVMVSTITPLVEESLFRSLLFERLRYRWGAGQAVIASASLFAIAHLSMVVGTGVQAIVGPLIMWFLLGMFLGGLRLQTGTLWAPILAHSTWNAVASLVALAAV